MRKHRVLKNLKRHYGLNDPPFLASPILGIKMLKYKLASFSISSFFSFIRTGLYSSKTGNRFDQLEDP